MSSVVKTEATPVSLSDSTSIAKPWLESGSIPPPSDERYEMTSSVRLRTTLAQPATVDALGTRACVCACVCVRVVVYVRACVRA
jgi:hypothetical protein